MSTTEQRDERVERLIDESRRLIENAQEQRQGGHDAAERARVSLQKAQRRIRRAAYGA